MAPTTQQQLDAQRADIELLRRRLSSFITTITKRVTVLEEGGGGGGGGGGGTGDVTLAGAQTFTGVKTFAADPIFNPGAVPPTALGDGSSVVLEWSGTDFLPTALKASSLPKTFVGPSDIDPASISGVVMHENDIWVKKP